MCFPRTREARIPSPTLPIMFTTSKLVREMLTCRASWLTNMGETYRVIVLGAAGSPTYSKRDHESLNKICISRDVVLTTDYDRSTAFFSLLLASTSPRKRPKMYASTVTCSFHVFHASVFKVISSLRPSPRRSLRPRHQCSSAVLIRAVLFSSRV